MVNVFDLDTPGRLIIRRANGEVYMDSADRTLVRLGARSYTNVAIVYPKFVTEGVTSIKQTSDGLRQSWYIGKEAKSFDVVLGAIGTPTPDWMMAAVKGALTSGAPYKEVFYATGLWPQFTQGEWMPLNGGSLHVESLLTTQDNHPPILSRILTVMPSGSNFIARCKQSSRATTRDDSPIGWSDTSSAFTFSFALQWGVFDL